jgi:hypothetical protein
LHLLTNDKNLNDPETFSIDICCTRGAGRSIRDAVRLPSWNVPGGRHSRVAKNTHGNSAMWLLFPFFLLIGAKAGSWRRLRHGYWVGVLPCQDDSAFCVWVDRQGFAAGFRLISFVCGRSPLLIWSLKCFSCLP